MARNQMIFASFFVLLRLFQSGTLADAACVPDGKNQSAAPSDDADCAPGGNFDLSYWNLQLPTGTDGNVDIIKTDKLQGCDGYTDENFFTDEDSGEMVLLAPGDPDKTGCVTTSGSQHCRTELREVEPDTGKGAAWSPKGENTLKVSMAVDEADKTAIGQIFVAGKKPLAEMYYNQDGDISVGCKPNEHDGQKVINVGNVPLGTSFEYILSYSSDVLSVTINGKKTKLPTGEWESPKCYFKSGNYNQATSADSAKVRISAIEVHHS